MKRSPKNLQISFSSKDLTHFGGLFLLQRFFQKINLRSLLSQYSPFPSAQQSLYHCRGVISFNLSHCPGVRRDRNNPPIKTQRCFPVSYGVTHLSQSHYLETFPPSDGSLRTSQIKEAPRSVSFIHDPKTLSSNKRDLRSGLDRFYPLWKIRDGSDWLQPQEVGPSFLSSASLFQWDHQGFLARGTSSRRYPYRNWSHRTSEDLLCQITAKLPISVKVVIIRADKGFYDHETIEYLESQRALFIIVAKLTAPIKRELLGLSYGFIPLAWRLQNSCTNPRDGKSNFVLW